VEAGEAMAARAMMICLDGADCDLVRRWAADGELPHLARLMEGGRSGLLATAPGLGDDAFWSSFHSGRALGEHGRYFWQQLGPDSRKLVLAREQRLPIPTFWERLSEAGHRVAVLDLPKCSVARELNGFHLCDWLVHGRDYPEPRSFPPGLAAEVVERFGTAPPSRCGTADNSGSPEDFVRPLLRSIAMKTAAGLHYLHQGRWDLFALAFKEAHCASHALWHLVEPRHPRFVEGEHERLGRPLLSVYRALDRALGTLVAEAGPQASVLLFTTLRMAPNHSGEHLVESLVEAVNRSCAGRFDGLRQAASSLRHAVRPRHQTRLSRWRRTLCRALPHHEPSAAIRLQVQGRDSGGRVPPGAYESLCAALAQEFRCLVHADSGAPAVAEVIEVHRCYPGPATEGLPDLFIVWDQTRPITSLRSPRLGLLQADAGKGRTGIHTAGGAYVVAGPAVECWTGPEEVAVEDLAQRFIGAAGEAAGAARARPPSVQPAPGLGVLL
jgi:predicted AlkP superfamily phosphohydrolase/phosphomutase